MRSSSCAAFKHLISPEYSATLLDDEACSNRSPLLETTFSPSAIHHPVAIASDFKNPPSENPNPNLELSTASELVIKSTDGKAGESATRSDGSGANSCDAGAVDVVVRVLIAVDKLQGKVN